MHTGYSGGLLHCSLVSIYSVQVPRIFYYDYITTIYPNLSEAWCPLLAPLHCRKVQFASSILECIFINFPATPCKIITHFLGASGLPGKIVFVCWPRFSGPPVML